MNGTLRLAAFYVVFFLQAGIYVPYWPLWLASEGQSPAAIGVLLGVVAWVRVIVAPYTGPLADRSRSLRRLLSAFAITALAGFLVLGRARSFGFFLLGMALVGLGSAPLLPAIDAWVLGKADRGTLRYGRIRLFGSASFILATAGAGLLLEGAAPAWIYRAVLFIWVGVVIACVFLPQNGRDEPPSTRAVSVRLVLRQPGFLVFLLAAMALHTSHAVLGGFGSLHWREQGGLGATAIGWLWAESVLFEILVFAVGHRLHARIGTRGLLVASSLAGLVRWPLLGESVELPVLICAQALHGLSFGAAHLGSMEFLRARVAPSLRHTASALYTASVMGLGFGLMMPISGWLYAALGAGAFWVMTVPSALGGFFGLMLAPEQTSKEQTSRSDH